MKDLSNIIATQEPIIKDENLEGKYKNKVAILSNLLVKKELVMNAQEQKLFFLACSQIKTANEDGVVRLNLNDTLQLFDIKLKNKPAFIKSLKNFMSKTFVSFKVGERYKNGFIIYSSDFEENTNSIYLQFDKYYIPLIDVLIDKGYWTKLYLMDIVKYKSTYTITLYRYLMSRHNMTYMENSIFMTTEELIELFGVKDKYYRKLKNGKTKFDRYNFEKKTLMLAVNEINENKTRLKIEIKKIPSIKDRRRIRGYQITFIQFDDTGYIIT